MNYKDIYSRLSRIRFMKYAVVAVLGIAIVGFIDDNSIWAHLRNKQRISELTEEIDRYNAAYQRDQAQIKELDRNPKAMEKIARERYFMKADGEDIFVLSDDSREPNPTAPQHETVE